MRKFIKISIATCFVILTVCQLSSCKNKDASVVKIFVRSASNQLLEGAQVVVIGDINSNPATMAYVDTMLTNASGFAEINMADFYTAAGSDVTTGYFDVIAKKDNKIGSAYVRSRIHITTVETIFLSN